MSANTQPPAHKDSCLRFRRQLALLRPVASLLRKLMGWVLGGGGGLWPGGQRRCAQATGNSAEQQPHTSWSQRSQVNSGVVRKPPATHRSNFAFMGPQTEIWHRVVGERCKSSKRRLSTWQGKTGPRDEVVLSGLETTGARSTGSKQKQTQKRPTCNLLARASAPCIAGAHRDSRRVPEFMAEREAFLPTETLS